MHLPKVYLTAVSLATIAAAMSERRMARDLGAPTFNVRGLGNSETSIIVSRHEEQDSPELRGSSSDSASAKQLNRPAQVQKLQQLAIKAAERAANRVAQGQAAV
ncbi:hypothetical protein C8J56DRAFT_1163740 [Mycena floridula]|nr:hypothetical protein C8J56DRAFT_1163740 [Mycena floridula]